MSCAVSDGSPLIHWGVGTAGAETVHVTSFQHISSCAVWRLFQVSGAHSHMVSCLIGESHREPAEITKAFCSLDTPSNWLYCATVPWQQQKFLGDTHLMNPPRTPVWILSPIISSIKLGNSNCVPVTPGLNLKWKWRTGWGMEERGQGRWEEEKKDGERRRSRGGVKDQKGEEERKRRDMRGSSLLLLSHSSLSFPNQCLSSKEEERWEGKVKEELRELFWLLTFTFSTLVSLFYFAFRS